MSDKENNNDKPLTRYEKMRQTMIKKHGSEEAWKNWMKEIASKGAKSGNNRPFRNKEIASKAGFISAKIRRKAK